MFTSDQIALFQSRLTARIQRLKAEQEMSADQRTTVNLDQQSVGRLSRMDALQHQAMALATDRRRAARIAAAKSALDTLDSEEFGYCQDCGEAIGIARLEHDPALRLCITCARNPSS